MHAQIQPREADQQGNQGGGGPGGHSLAPSWCGAAGQVGQSAGGGDRLGAVGGRERGAVDQHEHPAALGAGAADQQLDQYDQQAGAGHGGHQQGGGVGPRGPHEQQQGGQGDQGGDEAEAAELGDGPHGGGEPADAVLGQPGRDRAVAGGELVALEDVFGDAAEQPAKADHSRQTNGQRQPQGALGTEPASQEAELGAIATAQRRHRG